VQIGAALLLILVLCPGATAAAAGGTGESDGGSRSSLPRGPYLLRRIFGDLPRDSPELWDLSPGMRRREIPAGTNLGEEEKRPGSPPAFTRDFSGRATVTFVFEGEGPEARLDHITVTVVQAPNITPKTMVTHLTKIYGSADPLQPGPDEMVGSWQKGAVLLRHFSAARFYEVTLSSPRPPQAP
jgi:hypothetical protein